MRASATYAGFSCPSISIFISFLTRYLPSPLSSTDNKVATLLSVDDKGDGRYLVKNEIKMEIEGQEKPAYVAEALTMYVT